MALTSYGDNGIFAVWADKRDFREGYDIYGAFKEDQKNFAENLRVQDDFGGEYRQWHSTTAGNNDKTLVVAWTDERDGTQDIWLSTYRQNEWSDNQAVPGASGAREQSHPSIALDNGGNLHLAWVERSTAGANTHLKYLFAKRKRE